MTLNFSEKAAFLWSVADLLRGDYKQADYGKVIPPEDECIAPTSEASYVQ